MKKYVRFGTIPASGKSTNYYTEKKEAGVSVFELGEDGFPVTFNLALIQNMTIRASCYTILIVTGEEVGIGHDGEPLLKNVEVIDCYDKSREDIIIHAAELLKTKFQTVEGEFDLYNEWNRSNDGQIYTFWTYKKKCTECGRVYGYGEEACHPQAKKEEIAFVEWLFKGLTLKNPIEGFDTYLSYRGERYINMAGIKQ